MISGWGNRGEVKDLEVRGHLGVKGVNCHGNVLGPPNLVKRTTDLNAEQCWGPRSCRGHLGSSRGQFPWECPRTTKLGKKNHWPKHKTMLRSKVMQGSSGSSRGQFQWECPRTTKLGQKNHWPECTTTLGSEPPCQFSSLTLSPKVFHWQIPSKGALLIFWSLQQARLVVREPTCFWKKLGGRYCACPMPL